MSIKTTEDNVDLQILKHLQQANGAISAAKFFNYRNIWIRDNCQIAYCLELCGYHDFAVDILRAILNILHSYREKIQIRIEKGRPPIDEFWKLIHPVYSVDGKEMEGPWAWCQNDAVGLLLFVIGSMEDKSFLTQTDKSLLRDLVAYLKAIRYWQEDAGMWEEMEDYDIHASSIQSCVSGLKAIVKCGIDIETGLIEVGERVIQFLGNGHGTRRMIDLAHLQVYFPLRATRNILPLSLICRDLVRDNGVIRYVGDKYEAAPDGTEPSWPLGLYWIALSYAVNGAMDNALLYFNQAEIHRFDNGYIPESRARGVVCPHTPLAWVHAFAMCANKMVHNQSIRILQ